MGVVVFGVARLLDPPHEVQIWAEAEGERFVYTLASGISRNGRELTSQTTVTLSPTTATAAELNFVVPETGRYRLWLRARSRPGESSIPALEVRLAGRRFTTSPTGRMGWLPVASDLHLTAGLHRLKITLRAETPGEVDFDAAVLANDAGSLAGFSPADSTRPRTGPTGLRALGPANARLRNLAILLIATPLGCAVYLLILRLLRVEELAAALSLIRRPLPRA